MSVFNGDRYLREAVDSVLRQTLTDFELIIVDDGSVDGTATVLQSYSDDRIRTVRNEANLGQPMSLNRGIAAARGGMSPARTPTTSRCLTGWRHRSHSWTPIPAPR